MNVPLLLRILRWFECLSVESEHSHLKKAFSNHEDSWYVAVGEEAIGPIPFREAMKLLVDGHSPLSVLHASETDAEEPGWIPLSYSPLWLRPWVARGWITVVWGLGITMGYCVMLGVVPADWRMAGQILFWLGAGGLAAHSAGLWPAKKAEEEADIEEEEEPGPPRRRSPAGVFAFCVVAIVLGLAYVRFNGGVVSVKGRDSTASTEPIPSPSPLPEAAPPVFISSVTETSAKSAEPVTAAPAAPEPAPVFDVTQLDATPAPMLSVPAAEPVAAEPVPATQPSTVPAPAPESQPASELEAALRRSGLNRSVLEKAASMTGDAAVLRAMATIVTKSRTIDLVNYSAEHLLGTSTAAVRARSEMPWGRSISDELWTEYVLPPRIADEEMDDWRGEFYETLKPVLKESRDTKAAVLAIHKWLWTSKKVRFQVDESRDRSPRQTMKIGIGRCFEINILFTALLRSAGIPARHAGSSWWYTQDFYHYWVEYWDSEKKAWAYIEGASENPNWFMARDSKIDISTAYALPGWAKERDPIGREAWSELTDVTEHYVPVSEVRIVTTPGADVTAYTWNMSAWRSVAQKKADGRGECVFRVGASIRQLPYLFSSAAGDQVTWEPARVEANQKYQLRLQPGGKMEDKFISIAGK